MTIDIGSAPGMKCSPGKWESLGWLVFAKGDPGAMVCEMSEPQGSRFIEHHPPSLGSKDRDEIAANMALILDAKNLLDICRELVWAIDQRHGRVCSSETRREMEPVAQRAREMLAKHGEPEFPGRPEGSES